MFDALWRALADLFHPRVLVLTLAPLVVMGGVLGVAGWLGWEAAVDAVREAMQRFDLSNAAMQWLDSVGASGLRAVLAPIVVVAFVLPLVVVGTLLLVGVLMAPTVVALVARRRFPALARRRGARWWQGLGWSLVCAAAALVAIAASVPLWLIPPLALLLPPLVWGWLTYRVMAFDVLADHASAEERRQLMHERRWPLLWMGVACGALGALPTFIWALGTAALILAPFFLIASVWLYALVFAFAALWFAHYLLAELEQHRAVVAHAPAAAAVVPVGQRGGP
ncbi:MAG: EI24 domain-containing protein [Rubrivivax sp.]|nr:EI24 domain-containing protein [Rubrivivax sp.]